MSVKLSSTGQRALLIDAARLSRMAYSDPQRVQSIYQRVKSGKFGTDIETETVLKNVIEPPVYLNDPASDAQGYGVKYAGPRGPMTMVAYRGTSSLADAFADSEIRLVPLKTKKLAAQKGCCVHDGFLGQFKALEQQTDDFLQSVYGDLVTVRTAGSNESTQNVGETAKDRAGGVEQQAAEVVHEVAKEGEDSNSTVRNVVEKIEQGDLSMKDRAGIVAEAVVGKSSDIVGDVGHVVGGGTDSAVVYESFMGGPPLVFVGHSLGASTSSIGALVYALRFDSKGVSWSGFGCPRTGNKAWASLFDLRITQSTRVKNSKDPIDSIIPPVLYRHVGNTYAHIGCPDALPDLSLMVAIADHDIARYVANLQKDNTSETPLDWISFLFGILVNTPVRIYNMMRSITVRTI